MRKQKYYESKIFRNMEQSNSMVAVQQSAPTGNMGIDLFNPQFFETMQRVCKMYAHSELVPEMYRISAKNPESKAVGNCMIALEMASRIGASPLMIMQNMNIIYGRPGWSSKFLIATVNTCGRFDPLQFRFENLGKVGKVKYNDFAWDGSKGRNTIVVKEFDGTNLDNWQCVAFTTKRGGDAVLESAPVSILMAIQEGWYTKNNSKWVTMTKQMLTYRAASFWTSAYAPELSMGMKTTDEIMDIVDVEHEVVLNADERAKQDIENKNAKKVFDPELANDAKANASKPTDTQQKVASTEHKEPNPTPSNGFTPPKDPGF